MRIEEKHKHLEFIQAIVNRLGNNGFHAKSWAVTIVTAIFALAASQKGDTRLLLLTVSLIPVVIFWVLDGYYLWQERLFREHYKEVAKIDNDGKIDYQMNVGVYDKGRNTWPKSIFSKTLNIFYLTLLALMIGVTIIMSSLPLAS